MRNIKFRRDNNTLLERMQLYNLKHPKFYLGFFDSLLSYLYSYLYLYLYSESKNALSFLLLVYIRVKNKRLRFPSGTQVHRTWCVYHLILFIWNDYTTTLIN